MKVSLGFTPSVNPSPPVTEITRMARYRSGSFVANNGVEDVPSALENPPFPVLLFPGASDRLQDAVVIRSVNRIDAASVFIPPLYSLHQQCEPHTSANAQGGQA